MTLHLIYALFDPREPERIRYVGRTCNASKRLRDHCRVSINQAKVEWIAELAAAGVRPGMKVLEENVREDCVADAEIFWIAKTRAEGHPILNIVFAWTPVLRILDKNKIGPRLRNGRFLSTKGQRDTESQRTRERLCTRCGGKKVGEAWLTKENCRAHVVRALSFNLCLSCRVKNKRRRLKCS